MTETVSVRLDKGLSKILEKIEKPYLDKSSFMRELLKLGLKEYRLELAIEKYLRDEVSMWKAAEIAGTSLRKMNEIKKEKGIEMPYSELSLKEDLEE